jgi:hypothetical protein
MHREWKRCFATSVARSCVGGIACGLITVYLLSAVIVLWIAPRDGSIFRGAVEVSGSKAAVWVRRSRGFVSVGLEPSSSVSIATADNVHRLCRRAARLLKDCSLDRVDEVAAGWPYKATMYRRRIKSSCVVVEGGVDCSFVVSLVNQNGGHWEPADPVIPLRPCFPGLFLDVLLWSTPWVVLFVWRPTTRARRLAGGRCVRCGYSIAGVPNVRVCPECGKSTDGMESRSNRGSAIEGTHQPRPGG